MTDPTALDRIAASFGAQAGPVAAQANASVSAGPPLTSSEAERRSAWDNTRLIRRIKPAPQQLTVPASGVVTFDMDGPKTGYTWTVRLVAVSDSQAVTNSMGAAYAVVYTGQASPLVCVPDNMEWIITPCPNAANFGSDILTLDYGEHLFVQITGATVGQNLKCRIVYQLYQAGAPAVAAAVQV